MGYIHPLLSQRREQALENCRWLFGQEVQIITFRHLNSPSYYTWHAAILPKSCSLSSLAQCDINEKILLKASALRYWKDAMDTLLDLIDDQVGNILQPDPTGFRIDGLAIPEKCKTINPPPIEPAEASVIESSTLTTPATTEADETETITSLDESPDPTTQPEDPSLQLNNLLDVAARQLDDTQKTFNTLEKTITGQAEKLKRYEKRIGLQERIIVEYEHDLADKEKQIVSLKESLRETESARDTQAMAYVQAEARLEKELARVDEIEKKEAETNSILEKLFRARTEARAG